jgi:hypothetical protein
MARRRLYSALATATALAVVALGGVASPASADTVGPATKYFKSPLPVVGSILSDSSGTASFSVKDGWSVNDGDGICSASTTLYQSNVGYTNVWNYSGSRSVKTVSSNYTWTERIGWYGQLSTTATDCLGNTATSYEYIEPTLAQEGAASFGAGWSTSAGAIWSGGSVFQSSKAGASATYSFSGRLVSLISDKASNRGKVSLSVDGGAATTVNLKGSTLNRVIVWNSKYLSTSGSHLLTIKVVSGRVDIDAFLTQ